MKRWMAGVVLLLACCGACGLPIPSGTTAVHRAPGPQPADETDPVKRIPPAPVPGESPEAILKGFLAAGNEPDVARDYLTATNNWNPSDGTTVFTGDPVVKTTSTAGGGQAASVSITPILYIGSDGSTRVPDTAALKFTLTKENGEWRIAGLPSGTELQLTDLASSYRRGVLGWLSPDRRSLVRVSVLLPDPESLIPDLVSALFGGGPSLTLSAVGVTTVVPGKWSADPPTLDGSQLVLGVHTNGATVAASELPALRAQLAATLLSTEVTSIAVTVNGQPLLGGATPGAPVTSADEIPFDRDVVGSDPTGSYLATAGGITPLVLPGPFVTATPSPTVKATSSPTASPRPTASARPGARSASPSPSARTSPSPSPSATAPPTPVTTVNPGVPIGAFAVSFDGQRFAELRQVRADLQQPVQISLGSNAVQPLGPARDYLSVAWGADDSLWLTTRSGEVYLALRDHAPQQVTVSAGTMPSGTLPLNDLTIAPDGVNAVGISGTGQLVTALASDGAGGSMPGLTNVVPVAPSLKSVTGVAVTGSGVDGLTLLVAATQVANPLVPGSAGPPVTGLWRVSTGAPDPTDTTAESISETVAPFTTVACAQRRITGLVARPGTVRYAECSDNSVEAFDERAGPLDQQWIRVGTGLVGFPLG